MDANLVTTISLHSVKYDAVATTLETVSNKMAIKSLRITYSVLVQLNASMLSSFGNLIEIDLSYCSLFGFENGVFTTLVHLKVINLNNNVLNSLDHSLFRNNGQLIAIYLKNNLLTTIDSPTFSTLNNLQVLDFSFNFITILRDNCLSACVNLNQLYLNNCQVVNISPAAFNQLLQLTYLALEYNKITYLEEQVFYPTKNLRYLNLSNNVIREISRTFCWRLTKLQSIHLEGNQLTQTFDKNFFINNSKLVDVNLTDNNITVVGKEAFKRCKNLKFLNVKVSQNFEINSIKYLKFLTKFKLYYNVDEDFNLTSNFWINIKYDKTQLMVLKLTFRKLNFIIFARFSDFKNLECLHIECKQPKNTLCSLNFYSNFNGMKNLKKIVLKKINSLTLTYFTLEYNFLTYLDLEGINNNSFDGTFTNCIFLEYLNLSFSELSAINVGTFFCLVNLKYLDLAHTKIKHILVTSFQNTVQLETLICCNCLIETIEDFSFQNLHQLVMLDLRNNFLQNMSDYVFAGLNIETCQIILN